MRRWVALGIAASWIASGCAEPDEAVEDTVVPIKDRCEGGLVELDGVCTVLRNALDVLVFRTTNTPYLSTCTRNIVSSNPGIAEAVVAESAACRVIDTSLYGPPNSEPALREAGVTLHRDELAVSVDESDLFDGCVQRTSVPDGFFDYGGDFVARFLGNGAVPAFEASVYLPENPRFSLAQAPGGEMTFRWTPTAADLALAVVAAGSMQIVCGVDAGSGRLQIPAELVEMLPKSDPPGLEPLRSIRLRNRVVLPYPDQDAVVTLTADAYESDF